MPKVAEHLSSAAKPQLSFTPRKVADTLHVVGCSPAGSMRRTAQAIIKILISPVSNNFSSACQRGLEPRVWQQALGPRYLSMYQMQKTNILQFWCFKNSLSWLQTWNLATHSLPGFNCNFRLQSNSTFENNASHLPGVDAGALGGRRCSFPHAWSPKPPPVLSVQPFPLCKRKTPSKMHIIGPWRPRRDLYF